MTNDTQGVLLLWDISPDKWEVMPDDERAAAIARGDAQMFAITDPEWQAKLDEFRGKPEMPPVLMVSWIPDPEQGKEATQIANLAAYFASVKPGEFDGQSGDFLVSVPYTIARHAGRLLAQYALLSANSEDTP